MARFATGSTSAFFAGVVVFGSSLAFLFFSSLNFLSSSRRSLIDLLLGTWSGRSSWALASQQLRHVALGLRSCAAENFDVGMT